MTERITSFGRIFPPQTRTLSLDGFRAAARTPGRSTTFLAHGNGRSYGDSCLNGGGVIIPMRGAGAILAMDVETGVLTAEAGALLSDIIAYAAPHGFFPAVVPGTQNVTLGGAIANDIHGKNHHRQGTFGRHVVGFDLMRSDGTVTRCEPTRNRALFSATIGGMGLTGIILRATIRLMRVASLDVAETSTPLGNLDDYFDRAEEADRDNEYAVAWIDQIASGRQAGRGVLLAGNHAPSGARAADTRPARLSVPFQPPVTLLNRPFLTLFNAAYRRARLRKPSRISGYRGFFFPLDGVGDWNRLYGPRGLYQHQSVVPFAEARRVVPALMQAAREAGQYSFLTVLKRFGDLPSPGLLSFPRPGYTLTLDFPNRGEATLRLLDRLDRMTVEAGGAVNPYKDARMSPATFAASFPAWRALEAERDPQFLSDFWRRTVLARPFEARPPLAAE